MFEHVHTRTIALAVGIVLAVTAALAVSGCNNAAAPSSTVLGGTTIKSGVAPVQPGPLDGIPYVISAAKGKLNVTSVEIPIHAAVVFKNAEDDNTVEHQFVALNGDFDTGPLAMGVRYLVYFDKATSIPFIDKMDPSLTGTIVVSASVTSTQVAPGTVVSPAPGPWVGIRTGGPTAMTVQIKTGEAVNFYNAEGDATVQRHIVADDGSFDSGVLTQNQSFTFTFKRAGSFSYHDALDPTIKGTITVK